MSELSLFRELGQVSNSEVGGVTRIITYIEETRSWLGWWPERRTTVGLQRIFGRWSTIPRGIGFQPVKEAGVEE